MLHTVEFMLKIKVDILKKFRFIKNTKTFIYLSFLKTIRFLFNEKKVIYIYNNNNNLIYTMFMVKPFKIFII